MKTRNDIQAEIATARTRIKGLECEIVALRIEDCMMCDDNQWYKEAMEEIVVSSRPKRTENKMMGRIYWIEMFKDTDTGEEIAITRSRLVRENGVWKI